MSESLQAWMAAERKSRNAERRINSISLDCDDAHREFVFRQYAALRRFADILRLTLSPSDLIASEAFLRDGDETDVGGSEDAAAH